VLVVAGSHVCSSWCWRVVFVGSGESLSAGRRAHNRALRQGAAAGENRSLRRRAFPVDMLPIMPPCLR